MKEILSRHWAKKTLALVALLVLAGIDGLLAIELRWTSPTVNGQNKDSVQRVLNNKIESIVAEYQKEIDWIDANPQKLIGAFANTSVFSSSGANQRTYQGYDTFALTMGAIGSIQLPVDIFSMSKNLKEIPNMVDWVFGEMNIDHDIQLGINPQLMNAQVGINSSFLLKNLYMGFKGGYLFLPIYMDDFQMSFRTWSAGALANYQIIPQHKLLGELIVWRGLNLGTGFIYQNTDLTFEVPFPGKGLENGIINIGLTNVALDMGSPQFNLRFNVNTYTFPLEAITSIRFLGFLNVSVGLGADLGFGSANLRGSLEAPLHISTSLPNLTESSPGGLWITMRGENSPSFFNPKAMASFGFNAGPAIILDIPITYYLFNNGYNIGVTFGVAF